MISLNWLVLMKSMTSICCAFATRTASLDKSGTSMDMKLPLNPFPAVGIHDPASAGNSFRITNSTGTITKGALITGNTSGATATAILLSEFRRQ